MGDARLRLAGYGGHLFDSKRWRRGPELNRRIEVLQTSALPLGYRALKEPRTLLKFFAPRKDDFRQHKFLPRSSVPLVRHLTQCSSWAGGYASLPGGVVERPCAFFGERLASTDGGCRCTDGPAAIAVKRW